ncbi:hypothetical protein HGH92_01815 [Chitinophaga varians]|uniref:Uncharacterized protein n=1 Tax=Chitinophaga varians TaxID=2202339 RepID=A0A847RUJ4_9BACT|nr:hypothetical protein [Chitinophaga varians]
MVIDTILFFFTQPIILFRLTIGANTSLVFVIRNVPFSQLQPTSSGNSSFGAFSFTGTLLESHVVGSLDESIIAQLNYYFKLELPMPAPAKDSNICFYSIANFIVNRS